jgi:hypothetical protein
LKGSKEETIRFLSNAVEQVQKELHQLQLEKKSLEAPLKEQTPKPPASFDLSDIDLSPLGELRGRGEKIIREADTIGGLFQRLYFETQDGPNRRSGSKPGDIRVDLPALDGSSPALMFVLLHRTLKGFYAQLPENERKKNESLFQQLEEKLKKETSLSKNGLAPKH